MEMNNIKNIILMVNQHMRVIIINTNKLIFEGEYLNGKKNGKGKEYNDYNGKLVFEGEYLNGVRWNGKGKEYNEEGKLIFKENTQTEKKMEKGKNMKMVN